ncbi:sugar phosphate isomerase/epimerase family protein [Alteromonas oceanisediminis]|uniref:sugar phosphate isomerase/epimerase family protein n=1 Tax=Alteromonas oceanisediminis TaxID=2836180 RepID=UPI001BDA5551|nr:sugar phosphate isomerase/epimerase [Alteromonas oceanisediminis]MBT0584977.1 sugar phosphate isomerase/epimerase [Alteromonas oceanisediminis]
MKFSTKLNAFLISVATATISIPASAHEIGLQLYSLRHQMADDLPAAMQSVNDWGIHAVEGGGNLYGHSLSDFKRIIDEHHIQVVSVDTSYEEVRDNPIAVAYKAKFYGARFATFYWIPHEGTFSIDDAKAAVDVLNTAGAVLKENGVTLQYHPHGYEFFPHEEGTILDYMLTHVTEAQFQMDVFWIKQGGQDPVDFLTRYPGKFTSLHLKDRRHGTETTQDGKADVDTNVVLGSGDVGIQDVVKVAKQQGIKYFFIEDESSRVMLQVPESIRYLLELEGRMLPL